MVVVAAVLIIGGTLHMALNAELLAKLDSRIVEYDGSQFYDNDEADEARSTASRLRSVITGDVTAIFIGMILALLAIWRLGGDRQ